jgi:type VI secretion system protein
MTLTLTIVNVERLENGESTRLVLDRHGAVVGRSPHSDWSLPDPRNHISSTHCEIDYRDNAYVLIDKSTNGTFVNGGGARMVGPHVLTHGDEINIGPYRLEVSLAGGTPRSAAKPAASGAWGDWGELSAGARPPPERTPPSAAPSEWDRSASATPAGAGWADAPASPAPLSGWGADTQQPAAFDTSTPASARTPATGGWAETGPGTSRGWEAESAGLAGSPDDIGDRWSEGGSAISGRGSMSEAWAAPSVQSSVELTPSGWGADAALTTPTPTSAVEPADVWARLASSNQVDWARSGLDAKSGWAAPSEPSPPPAIAAPSHALAMTPTRAEPAPAPGDGAFAALLASAGLTPGDIHTGPAEAAAAAGDLLRRLTSGMLVMLEARARAKAQLGAQATALNLEGNSPLKFARSPERALLQLLNPQEKGFMPADRAVEDAFHDLQAHQIATLAAMQSALRSTLDRFSPSAIRKRAEVKGVLAKIIPSARDATLWQTYEREFEGVAQGSDEAFMDVFAKSFRAAYEKSAAELNRK